MDLLYLTTPIKLHKPVTEKYKRPPQKKRKEKSVYGMWTLDED
jgi:hypothetical protein